MTKNVKYHPLVTPQAVEQARQYVLPDVTDDEVSQLLSDTFDMLETWLEPEVQ